MFKINRPHKTLRTGHADFTFSPDGIVRIPRASFEISQGCPESYRQIILECIGNGWVKPVAHMRDTEYTMELLQR